MRPRALEMWAGVGLLLVAWCWLAPCRVVRADEAAQGGDAAHAAAEDGHGDAEAAHEDAAHGEGHGSPNPLSFKEDLALWTGVVFIVLLIVLTKFAWKPIIEGLERREHGIAANIAAAQKSHDDAKALLAQYETRLSGVQDEVKAILDEARRDAEHTQQEILAKAQADAAAAKDRALREIDQATAASLKELAERGANLAVDLAGKIVKEKLSAADHARLIQDAVARFPQQSSRN